MALGNHEFDFGPDFLNLYLKNSVSQFMAANLYSELDQPVTGFLPNTKRSQIFTIGNNFKIGVIGLITVDTPQTSSGFTQHLFPDYKFKDYADIVYAEAKTLRSNGAHAVIIMAHEGNSCPGQSMTMGIWKKTTNQTACPDGPITHILDLLPNGTIDAVVQGHRHEIVHFYKNGVPIVGNINGGFYFNLLYLTFNKLTKKLVDTSIEGPIPVCERIFSNLKRCPYVAPKDLKAAGDLVKWKFHNQDVIPSNRVQTLFNEWLPLMKPYLEDLVENDVYLEVSKDKETELGNLVADLYFKAGQGNVDFSLVNPGSFRTTWNPGMLQYQHFYNMFPFENKIETFVITGRELKQMFKILQAGRYGFYITTGLDMTVSMNERSLVNISTSDGDEIVDDVNYVGITSDFMLNGGDDMSDIIGKIYTPRNRTSIGPLRTTLKSILADMKIIKENTLINPNHPRLVVLNK
jgi:5'-nucleotidase